MTDNNDFPNQCLIAFSRQATEWVTHPDLLKKVQDAFGAYAEVIDAKRRDDREPHHKLLNADGKKENVRTAGGNTPDEHDREFQRQKARAFSLLESLRKAVVDGQRVDISAEIAIASEKVTTPEMSDAMSSLLTARILSGGTASKGTGNPPKRSL